MDNNQNKYKERQNLNDFNLYNESSDYSNNCKKCQSYLGLTNDIDMESFHNQPESFAQIEGLKLANSQENIYNNTQHHNSNMSNKENQINKQYHQTSNYINYFKILFIDEWSNMSQQKIQGEKHFVCNKCNKVNSTSFETNFDQKLFSYERSDDYDKCSNFQKISNNTINFCKNNQNSLKQQSSTQQLQNDTYYLPENDSVLNNFNKIANENRNNGYLQRPQSPKSAVLRSFFFQDASINKQNQKQYLLEQDKVVSIPCWGISSQANLNNQLKEKFFENFGKVSKFRVKLNNRIMMEMIQNRLQDETEEGQNKYSINNLHQSDAFYENFVGEQYYNYRNGQSWNLFQNERLEGDVENAYCNFQKNEVNYQAFNERDQKDEDLIYDSGKLQLSNLTHIFEETENYTNPIEFASKSIECSHGQPQLLQMSGEEQHYGDQNVSSNHLLVENQGELSIYPFPQQQEKYCPLYSQQQKINQISKIDNNLFQEQYQTQSNQQINPSPDSQNNQQQQIHQKNYRDWIEYSSFTNSLTEKNLINIESYSSIEISRNDKNSSQVEKADIEEGLSENQNPNKLTEDENQDNTTSKSNDSIVEKVTHLNKKNIVRNIIRAFKKYFLNKKSNPQVGLQFFPHQSLDISRNQFKQYFTNKKLNNSILKQLIIHPTYGEIFNYFLSNRSNDYLGHSNVKAKESHELFINYLVLCYNDPQKLAILETYTKL